MAAGGQGAVCKVIVPLIDRIVAVKVLKPELMFDGGNLVDPDGSGQYQFDPSRWTFRVGQEVNFILRAETEFHTFTVDDLGIDLSVVGVRTENFTFTFDRPGEYRLICIPHQALGMVGTITVN